MTFAVANDPEYVGSLARLRARAALKELVGPERQRDVDTIRWQLDAWSLTKKSLVLQHELNIVSRGPIVDERDAARAAIIAARAWEALAISPEHVDPFLALVQSAVAYELAGYQANAAAVARVAERRLRRGTSMEQIVAAFIQRQFLRLPGMINAVSRPPLPSVYDQAYGGEEPEPEASDLTDDELAVLAAQFFAASGLGAASSYFLVGDESGLEHCEALLGMAHEGFSSAGRLVESNLVTSLQAMIPIMRARSTWNQLGEYLSDQPRWKRYLRVLARGVGRSILHSRSVSELWPSQLEALGAGLLEGGSKVIKMPTSAGKTRVAEMAIVHQLVTVPTSRCFYIAPFRALADEVEAGLDQVIGEVGFSASSLVGGLDITGVEDLVATTDHVLVLTPEKADLLLRLRPELFEAAGLIILDEGHIVGDETRGARYELLISRLRRRAAQARFLFLSAVVPEQTLLDFAGWLGAGDGVIRSEWRPAVQRVASFEWQQTSGVLRYKYSSLPDEVPGFERFLPRLIAEETFEWINPETNRRKTRRFPDASNRGQLVAGLAFEFLNTGPVLMFCPQTNLAQSTANALLRRLELAQLTGGTIPKALRGGRVPSSARVAAAWLGDDHDVTIALRARIGVHHGRLPDPVRRAVEDDFRAGALKVLAATNTLGQGVNLPVRTVIVHSVHRRDDYGGEHRTSARDYWNIAGRAGRAGHETDGLVVHLVRNTRDRDDLSFYLASVNNVEPVESSLIGILRQLVERRISSEDAVREMDAGLLALLVEENAFDSTQLAATVTEFIDTSLFGVQAARQHLDTAALSRAAIAGAAQMYSTIPLADLAVFARTGLSSTSCLSIQTHVRQHASELRALLQEDGPATGAVELLVPGVAGLQEMQPRRSFDGSYEQLIIEWMSGRSLGEISRQLATPDGSPLNLGSLSSSIEEMGSILLPWGLSAYLQIAEAELSTEVGPLLRSLPGLVKFGVPTPPAAWLMGLGIDSREAALLVAQEAARAEADQTPEDLRRWLARSRIETIGVATGLVGHALENVARVRHRAARALLAAEYDATNILPRDEEVLIEQDDGARAVAARFRVGTELKLSRDYDDLMDRNAIHVLHGGIAIGVLPADAAALLALELDGGMTIRATVIEPFNADADTLKVTLE